MSLKTDLIAQIRKGTHPQDLSGADLSACDLRQVNLSGVNLFNANLSCSDLTGAELSETNFQYANLAHCNLSKTNLFDTKLDNARLTDVRADGFNLRDTTVEGADFSRAYLISVNITHVTFVLNSFDGATFENFQFYNIKLDRCVLSDVSFTDGTIQYVTIKDCITALSMEEVEVRNIKHILSEF